MTKYPLNQKGILSSALLILMLFLASCGHDKPLERNVDFPTGSWQRYNKLKFELPVKENGKTLDVIFELRCKKSFVYDEIPLNMILDTPSGEERIKEYLIQIRDKNGNYSGTLNGDTCISRIFLKRKLYCSKKGILKVEIENLNPRMKTEGVISARLILIGH